MQVYANLPNGATPDLYNTQIKLTMTILLYYDRVATKRLSFTTKIIHF